MDLQKTNKVAFVIKNNAISLYINGNLDIRSGSPSLNNLTWTSGGSPDKWYFNNSGYGNDGYIKINNLQFWNQALTDYQINFI